MAPAGENRCAAGRFAEATCDMSDCWGFGYGSLMWRPGFDHLEAVPARLAGKTVRDLHHELLDRQTLLV